MKYLIIIALLPLLLSACTAPIKQRLNLEQNLDLTWDAIESNDDLRIQYVFVNSSPFITDTEKSQNIVDYLYVDSLYTLDGEDYFALTEFIADSSNFMLGECGTFALNAGFIITENNSIKGIISLGCGFSQWGFEPYNTYAQDGNLTDIGFNRMSVLIDRIESKWIR